MGNARAVSLLVEQSELAGGCGRGVGGGIRSGGRLLGDVLVLASDLVGVAG